jgi:16S rRNA (uracil1498-N3)-methyltransferase
MSCPWFHVSSIPPAGGSVALDRDEARHALGVRRLGPGDPVTLFDGAGSVADAVIAPERDRAGGTMVKVTSVRDAPRPTVSIVAALAPPKGDRWSTALDMLAQLSVEAVVPIDAEFGVVDAAGINRPRAERILLEACKQSRSAWRTVLGEPVRLEEFVRLQRGAGRHVLLADAAGGPIAACDGDRLAFAVGPEGGFSAAERAAAIEAGARPVSIGSSVLRVETAAVAMAAALRARADGR